jgi:hypothetical protein
MGNMIEKEDVILWTFLLYILTSTFSRQLLSMHRPPQLCLPCSFVRRRPRCTRAHMIDYISLLVRPKPLDFLSPIITLNASSTATVLSVFFLSYVDDRRAALAPNDVIVDAQIVFFRRPSPSPSSSLIIADSLSTRGGWE